MKRLFFIAVSLVLGCADLVNAQNVQYLQDISGKPISSRKAGISGSPYFNEEFLRGTMTIGTTKYVDVLLRLDQLDDKLAFKKTIDGVALEPVEQVAAFTLQLPTGATTTFKYVASKDTQLQGFYQMIEDGSTSFLKRTKKSILETVAYNSAGTEKSIKSKTDYFIKKSNGDLKLVKKDRKDILTALEDKRVALSEYINKESLSFKSDVDIARLVAYYNAIK